MPVIETDPEGTVRLHREGSIAVVTIDRPTKLNTLTLKMLAELQSCSDEIRDDDSILAAVITGAGDRAFCAGGSLASTLPAAIEAKSDITSPEPRRRFFSDVYKPLIAAIRGVCVGGGFEIVLGCDLRVASQDATFGLPEVSIGLIPGGGSHVRLPRQIPYAVAMQMLLLGETIGAERAYEIGFLNWVTTTDGNMSTALDVAGRFARLGPIAVQTAKEIVVRTLDIEESFTLEHELNTRVLNSEDALEGTRAFVERRSPVFGGH